MARRPVSDRAQRAAAMQRQARRQEQRRAVLVWGSVAVVVLAIVGAVGYGIASKPSLAGVEDFDELGRDHVAEAVDYEQDPPVGGDHNQVWWTCGIYDDPIPEHHAVHSLEHGAVWLTYQPDISEDDKEALVNLADQEFMLLSPDDSQAAPVVASAWGKQLSVQEAQDDRLQLFIEEFRQGPQTPEPGAACTGGTTTDLLTGQG